MEVYSHGMNHLPRHERAKLNYDAPNAIDVKLLESDIRDYAAGKAIEAPIYNIAEHKGVSGRREHMLPATRQYVLPSKSYADVVLEATPDLATVERNLYDAIVKKRDRGGVR